MLSKRIILLVICLITSSLSVAFLAIYVNWQNNRPNSFIRKVPSHSYVGERPTKLLASDYYIAGVSKTHCYLANHRDWSRLLQMDSSGRILEIPLKFSDNDKVYENATWAVDEQHILLYNGIAGEIWQGNLKNPDMHRRKISTAFAKAVSLSNGTFILKTLVGNRTLIKKMDNGHIVDYPKVLEPIGKGIFAPDGIFVRAPGSKKLFYTSYYKNKFLSFDEDLNLIYEGKTIDTVAHPNIKTAYLKSSQSMTIASPSQIVNKRSFANNKYLFVQSALKADNENSSTHEDNAAIDIYRVSDGRYALSLYLPKIISGESLTDLAVLNNRLIALYGHYVFRFRLNF